MIPETIAQSAITRDLLWLGIRALDRLVRASRGRRDVSRYERALEDGEQILGLMKNAVPR